MDKNDKLEEIVDSPTNDLGYCQNPLIAVPTNEDTANIPDEPLSEQNGKGHLNEQNGKGYFNEQDGEGYLSEQNGKGYLNEHPDTVDLNIPGQNSGLDPDGDRNRIFEKFNVRNFIAFWFIGMINNYHYCLVLSASNTMAKSFGLGKLIALITWVNVVGGIFIRLFNTFASPTTSYLRRFLYGGIMTLSGIIIVCISPYCGSNNPFKFFLLLVGVFNVGNGSHWGESVALGYMERYPSKYIGGWSSGTGFSGVLAAIVYMGLKYAGLNNPVIFGINSVFVLIYWAAFYFMLYVPYLNEEGVYEPRTNLAALSWKEGEIQKQTIGLKIEDKIFKAFTDDSVASPEEKSSFRSWWNSPGMKELRHWHNFILFNNINLMLVYVFEYAIQFISPFCFPCDTFKSSNFFLKNAFVITQFCYQFGVLFSRSSLSCIRIPKVYILTIIQFVFMICWLIQSKALFLSDKDDAQGKGELKYAIILYIWMYFVGLMGGASYVNVFHNILEQTKKDDTVDPIVLKERRQLCMNIGAIYASVGITLGSILDVIFSNTAITSYIYDIKEFALKRTE